MLYRLLKFPARLAILIYCKYLKLNTTKYLDSKGPLLLAVNHPNSFLDAIILSTIFNQPVHSLTRGDVFKKPFFAKILRATNMHPVYRLSEGAENIGHNYASFEACRNIFKNDGIVLIFSEGRCENEWHLRPLMKGTARLALSAWEEGIPLKILPIGLNFHSFRAFGKIIHVNFGTIFTQAEVDNNNGFGKTVASFNNLLKSQLENLVYEIDKDDSKKIKSVFNIRLNNLKKTVLFFPAIIGIMLHFPLYQLVRALALKYFSGTGHHDSVMVALLFLLYPIYLVVLLIVAAIIFKSWWVLLILLAPFFAWSYVQWKDAKI